MAVTHSSFADDWTQWRGPNRDGISKETGLLKQWPEGGPDITWKVSGLGLGYSSVAVADGLVFTLGDVEGEGNFLIALDERSGAMMWKKRIGDDGGHKRYKGPRSTPTVAGQFVVALNQHSDLVCLDAETGTLIWSRNLVQEFGGQMMSGWKYSESPLVDGNQVICTPGGGDGTLLALDLKTGEKNWQTGDWTDRAGYSSVIIATIHGKRQYVQLTGQSVAGVDPKTGEVIWKAERAGKTAVIATPVVRDNIVFVTSSYGVGCNGFKINNDGTAEEIYASTNIANHHGGVILLDDHVYGSSGGTFRCLDIESGELAFNERSAGKGATTYADGHFYLRSEKGPIALIEATDEGYVEVSRFDQPDRSDESAWAHPVVANGKLYIRDQDIMFCFDIRK